MPFARPTLSELVTRIRADLRGRLSIAGPLLRRAMVDVLGAVWAGAVHELHGYLRWLALQLFAQTAEREFLLRIAAMFGITPTPAAFATGNFTATGTNGTLIPAGTIIRLDEATAYRVVTGQTISGGGTATLPLIALIAGTTANIPAGTTLTFESPVLGVAATGVVATGGMTGGASEENTEEVRERLLLRLRQPPTGGSDQDYIGWTLRAPGVTRAWVYRHELGLGTVVVRFVLDDPDTGEVGFPSGGDISAVAAIIAAERPTTAYVEVVAPTDLPVPFTISLVPNTADTRAAATSELDDLLRRVAEPGDGAGRGTVLLSQIRTAVGNAAGVTDYTITVPSANVVPGTGALPTVGTITWV